MARAKKHKDVEFHVERLATRKHPTQYGGTRVFKSYAEAAQFAGDWAAQGMKSVLDVVIYSKAGARWWGGDWAVEQYLEDPDASVFYRVEITGKPIGRIP